MNEIEMCNNRVKLLIEGIATIATQLEIINEGTVLSGIEALMLVDDIIGEIVSRSNNDYHTQELYEGG